MDPREISFAGPGKTEGGADAPLHRIPVGYRGARVGYLAVPAGTSRFLPAERRRLLADLVGASASVYVEVDDTARARPVLERMRGVGSVKPEAPGFAVELDGVTRPQLVARLVRAGIGVETVVSRHRLEDAFVDLLDEGAAP